jgi:hypothetical protein
MYKQTAENLTETLNALKSNNILVPINGKDKILAPKDNSLSI